MNRSISIDISKARNDFFNLIRKVYNEGVTVEIKKSGIPVARIEKPKASTGADIMKFAGAWKNIDTEDMIAYIYEGRKDSHLSKKRK